MTVLLLFKKKKSVNKENVIICFSVKRSATNCVSPLAL